MSTALPDLQRLHRLIGANTGWLQQALRLVDALSDTAFAESPAGLSPHRAGSHLRHVLDFYDSFLTGVASGEIDYDARNRDRRTERDRRYAMERIRAVIASLEAIRDHPPAEALLVRMEDAADDPGLTPWMPSSVTRELQTLSSHTIHHFALIAVTLSAHGLTLDPNFGMAPSTVRHAARRDAA